MGLTQNLGRLSPSIFSDASLNIGVGAAPSGTYKFQVTGASASNSIYAIGDGSSGGALKLKQYLGSAANEDGYSTISTLNTGVFYFTSAGTSPNFKNFVLNPSGLTDNTLRSYTLPDASGTIALVGGAGVGTVTSVAALTLGTTGTDLSSTVANSTTTPVITLNVPTASAANRGALSSGDWTTFNSKQGTITLTTTGTSGAATFSANTLNIPNYGSALSGYLPLTGGTLTGALGGTSATFTSTLLLNSASSPSAGFILFNYASNASSRSWKVSNDQVDWGDFAIQQSTTQTGSTYATKLLINATGNVGINTSTVPAKLTIYTGVGGAFPATSGTTQSNGLVARYKDTSNACIDYGTNGGSGGWLQVTNITDLSASYPFLINPNGGNVGIGTSSPTARLEVYGGESGMGQFTLAGTYGGIMRFAGSGVNKWAISVESGLASDKFGIFSYTANAYVAVITTGGNFGIGTASPAQKLTVIPSTNLSTATTGTLSIGEASDNTGYRMHLGYLDLGGWRGFIQTYAASVAAPLLLNPSGGNVLIGTTTDDTIGKLQVTGNVTISNTAIISRTRTNQGSVSNPYNVWTTMFSVTTGDIAMYQLIAVSSGNGLTYTSTALVVVNGSGVGLHNKVDGGALDLQASGYDIQCKNGSGSTLNINWTYLRIS